MKMHASDLSALKEAISTTKVLNGRYLKARSKTLSNRYYGFAQDVESVAIARLRSLLRVAKHLLAPKVAWRTSSKRLQDSAFDKVYYTLGSSDTDPAILHGSAILTVYSYSPKYPNLSFAKCNLTWSMPLHDHI